MLHHKYSERPAPVKKTPHNDPWVLLNTMLAEQEVSAWLRPPSDVAEHFFRLTARRRSPQERDHLVARGLDVFGYRLADAIREVERHVLEHMVENN